LRFAVSILVLYLRLLLPSLQLDSNVIRQKVEANLPDEAISIYSTLLSRPDLTPLETRLATFNLGVIHHRKGDINKALEYWQTVAEKPVNHSNKEAEAAADLLRETEEMELCAAANMNLGIPPPSPWLFCHDRESTYILPPGRVFFWESTSFSGLHFETLRFVRVLTC